MSLSEEEIDATLEADGNLRLAHPPHLPPGPVKVTIRSRPLASAPGGLWEGLQAARRQMEEAGCPFMDEAEGNAHIEWLREGDHIDDRLRDADRRSGQS
jgi:hypothetical protein